MQHLIGCQSGAAQCVSGSGCRTVRRNPPFCSVGREDESSDGAGGKEKGVTSNETVPDVLHVSFVYCHLTHLKNKFKRGFCNPLEGTKMTQM